MREIGGVLHGEKMRGGIGGVHCMRERFGFVFSLEAAFSLTLVIFAAAYLFAFVPQKEDVGWFLSCADAAEALSKSRAFSSQAGLDGAVEELSGLSGACLEAEAGGMRASSCSGKRKAGGGNGADEPGTGEGTVEYWAMEEGGHGAERETATGSMERQGGNGEIVSFSFPVWSGGKLLNAKAGCSKENG
jgi:hypothetical protein